MAPPTSKGRKIAIQDGKPSLKSAKSFAGVSARSINVSIVNDFKMRPKSASVKATPGLVQPHLVNASAPSRHGNSNVSQKNSLQSAPLLSVAHSLHAPLVQQYRPQLAQQYQRNRAPNFSQKLQQREIVPNNQPAYMYQNQATLPENLKQPVPKKNKSSVRLLNFSSTKKMKTYSQN